MLRLWAAVLAVFSPNSDSLTDRSQPAKQKEVVAAKTAAVGQNDPLKRLLHRISNTHASEIDRLAMWTSGG
jgi:hypothetical protein